MMEAARRKRILKKCEESLSRGIAARLSASKIEAAAEKVRMAQISHLKGQYELVRYLDDPTDSQLNHMRNIQTRTNEWQSVSVLEIVQRYSDAP